MDVKGFDENLRCRGMQFEVGKEYSTGAEHISEYDLCSNKVIHFCKSLQKVHSYYACNTNNRFCEVSILGEEVTDGNKCGTNRIKIIREITGNELDIMLGKINGNTGLFNSGGMNSGDRNSGDMNSGNWNSGFGNSCDFSNGVFCSESDMNIRIFNSPSGMSLKDWYRSKYYDACTSAPFKLTEWVEYTKEEKASGEKKAICEGHLITYTWEEAWAMWWNKLSKEAKKTIQEIPNFNTEIFKEITGIDVESEETK